MSKYDVLKSFIAGITVVDPVSHSGFDSSFTGILSYYNQPFALRITPELIIVRDLSTLTQGQSLIRNTLASLARRESIEVISLGSDFNNVATKFKYGKIRSRKDILAELV